MTTEHDRRLPDELSQAPDIRTVDLQSEIYRCARVLRWVEALPAAELVSSHAPVLADDLVSVVVPMYNASRWIEACLKGLLAQTHRNIEIFCVDDCSEDDTYGRVVDQFGRDGRLCVVRLARNVGPFQISNWVAGSLARGRQIAWQDADNVSHPARIEAQCRWMSQQRYRIGGTCVHHFFPPHIKPFASDPPPVEADGMLHELLMYVSKPRAVGPERRGDESREHWERAWQSNELGPALCAEQGLAVSAFRSLTKDSCLHGSQMVERELFREFGGFYGRTKLGEDTEFDWRVSRFHDIGNLPRVLCSKRSHGDSLMRHPTTGMESPARQQYREFKKAKQEQITRELNDGNTRRARELCTETLHRAEIQIDRAHAGFEIALS